MNLLYYVFGIVLLFTGSISAQTLPSEVALPIGIKIWFNESSGDVDGLTSWNHGEHFASLGIGHFIWYPQGGPEEAAKNSSFPALLKYFKEQKQEFPKQLKKHLDEHGTIYAPWKNRAEFMAAKRSPLMCELRAFLSDTITLQSQFIADQFMKIREKMLAKIPAAEKAQFKRNLQALSSSASGLYALIDYLNFKGSGLNSNLERGSGLTQVIYGMKYAPQTLSLLEAYVWSAKRALARRVLNTDPKLGYERWLSGWYNRLDTYLAGDLVNLQIV